MAVNPAVPFYSEGYIFTCHAGAAITGKRLVKVLGAAVGERPVVVPCTAAAKALGVAAYDAASGEGVTVYRVPSVMPVNAGAAITAGNEVESNATGQAIPLAAGKPAGIALADAANGADAKIALT